MPNKKKGKSSAQYYKENPESLKKKREYQREYNKKPSQVEKRVELAKVNRERGTYGNNDGLDASHQKNGSIKMEKASKNRGNKTNTKGDRKARGGNKK